MINLVRSSRTDNESDLIATATKKKPSALVNIVETSLKMMSGACGHADYYNVFRMELTDTFHRSIQGTRRTRRCFHA